MVWVPIATIQLKSNWQYTPNLSGEWFRLKHLNFPKTGLLEMVQAQTIFSSDFFNLLCLKPRLESEVLCLPKPPVFQFQRLGFRLNNPVSSNWKILIETYTMPLTHAPSTLQTSYSAVVVSSTVAASTSAVNLLAANSSRKGATVTNSSTAALYLDLETTSGAVSATKHAVKLPPGSYFELPYGYTGTLTGIWDAANGSALVREFV